MKCLAIDYGLKRTGIALSDPSGIMAYPLTTIQMQGKDYFFSTLLRIAAEEKIEAFIVGLPLYFDGSESETTRQVRNMTARLQRRTSLPIYMIEETLSSYAAEDALRAMRLSREKIKECVDQAAAVAILESFLALSPQKRIPL